MRTLLPLALVLGVLGAAPASALPHGSDHFRLGMSRSQVDSAITARGLAVISNSTAFLVCASDDTTAEYEQYSFFRAPHGVDFLWRVTIGYRLGASLADYAVVRERLVSLLGAPETDSWDAGDSAPRYDLRLAESAQHAVWVDELTAVQLGARWTEAPDSNADRMLVSWVDRRLQRLIQARRKKDKPPDSQ